MTALFRVCEWVKTNRLINEANNIVLDASLNQIIHALGGAKSMLLELTKSLKIEQIKEINNIISNQQRKFNSETNNESTHSNDDDDINSMDETNSKSFSISDVPNACLSHICGYLNKNEINIFKLTSKQIAIVCMNEMNKITIGSINGNNLLHPDINLYLTNTQNLCQMNRFSITKKYDFVMEQWAKMYNIPIECQILFQIKNNCVYMSMPHKKCLELQSKQIRVAEVDAKLPIYLVCDMRNIVIVTDNKCG
eukprot:451692_1